MKTNKDAFLFLHQNIDCLLSSAGSSVSNLLTLNSTSNDVIEPLFKWPAGRPVVVVVLVPDLSHLQGNYVLAVRVKMQQS